MLQRKGKKINRLIAALLAFTMLLALTGGCGNGNSTESGAAGDFGEGSQTWPEAMGRYVEEPEDFSDKLSGDGNRFFRLSDGSLIVTDRLWSFTITRDNGKTWGTNGRIWRTKMKEDNTYIMSVAIGADDTACVIYQDDEEEEAKEGSVVLNPKLLVIKPDNTEIPVNVEITEEDRYLYQVYAADNGRIFVTTRGSSKLYEVKEDASSEVFLTLEYGRPELIQFQNNLMVIDGYDYDGLVIYDMEKEEYIEDEILNEFVNQNYSDRDNGNGSFYDMYFFFGEDGVLYLAGAKGLYRHVIGGSAIEQVIDGELCSLSNPAYGLQGMAVLDNNDFIALFEGSRMIRYTYNPDIPAVPSEKLTVYSLEDNETVRQAINLYQTKNPETFIKLEIGMESDSSITREDALKSLNTRIIAGEGPDMLVLDHMPIDSYMEKGLLLDLSPVLNELKGEDEIFENITEAMKRDNKIYVMPCEVWLPMMLTKGKYVSQVSDLKDVADMMEELRKDNPEKDLLGICSEKGIMRLFSMSCVPAWTTQDGKINEEAIGEYLEQIKRIYDAQMDGVPDKVLDHYSRLKEDYALYQGVISFEDSEYLRKAGFMNYVGGYTSLLCGIFDYMSISSIHKINDFEDSEWITMKGQGGNVFCGETLLGISSASKNIELSEEFLKVCLGKENQSYLYDSIPVNKSAFEESLVPDESQMNSTGFYCSVVTIMDDGSRIQLIIYWPEEEEIAAFRKCIEEADTAYIENDVLESVVYEEGIAYIQGTKSLEEAVNDIEKKVSIYLAE